MNKTPVIPAAEFTRNFGRYRMLAQKSAVPVSSHGHLTGYFVPADEYEAFEKFQKQKRSFATAELTEEKINQIAATEMDSRHDHLNAILEAE
jgi:PHD/YefM family antitoxin component YafN of YafNO toxin-antitoxin module